MQILGYEVPDVIVSAVFASGLTLAGVMLSNWGNTRRLIKQLGHDSTEKRNDRILSIRREVYLKAAEEMAKIGDRLGRIPQLDPAKVNISDGFSEFFAASAKLQLVADIKTSELAGELTARYGEILIAMLEAAMPIHELNSEIRISGEILERRHAEVAKILAEMSQLNDSGHFDEPRFVALQESFKAAQALANELVEERSKSYDTQATAMRGYMKRVMEEMLSVGALQAELTAALRADLSLDTDLKKYRARRENERVRMEKAAWGFMKKLDSSE